MLKKILSFIIPVFLIVEILSIPISATESKKIFSKNAFESKKIALTFDDGPHPRYTEHFVSDRVYRFLRLAIYVDIYWKRERK